MNVHRDYLPEVGDLPLLHLKHIKYVCKVYKGKLITKRTKDI